MLSWVRITQIEDAEFNISLPADAFAATAPKEVNVFDQRKQDSVRAFKTSTQVSDLTAAADEHLRPRPPPPDERWRLWLVGINVLVLLATVSGWLLWKRARRRSKAT